jgi:hypothetical protein
MQEAPALPLNLCLQTHSCGYISSRPGRLLWTSDVECIIRWWIITMRVTDGSNGGEQQRQTATSALWEDKEAGKECAEGEVGVSRDRCYDPL